MRKEATPLIEYLNSGNYLFELASLSRNIVKNWGNLISINYTPGFNISYNAETGNSV